MSRRSRRRSPRGSGRPAWVRGRRSRPPGRRVARAAWNASLTTAWSSGSAVIRRTSTPCSVRARGQLARCSCRGSRRRSAPSRWTAARRYGSDACAEGSGGAGQAVADGRGTSGPLPRAARPLGSGIARCYNRPPPPGPAARLDDPEEPWPPTRTRRTRRIRSPISRRRRPACGRSSRLSSPRCAAWSTAHIGLARAEAGEIMGEIGRAAGLAARCVRAGLPGRARSLPIGGLLFLGEWIFGSIGWGVLLGSLLLLDFAVVAVAGRDRRPGTSPGHRLPAGAPGRRRDRARPRPRSHEPRLDSRRRRHPAGRRRRSSAAGDRRPVARRSSAGSSA